jgi:hypothetical protein
VIDGIVSRRDKGHMSMTYSERIAGVFRESFRRELDRLERGHPASP